VGIADVVRVDVSLEVGAVAESIEVTAAVARVQTDSAEVGTSLSNKSLLDLPLTFSGGRVAEAFAFAVTPGVTGNSWTAQVNGSTSQSKETLLEGATVTTERAGHFGESSVSVEALQEFRVQTSGISAEYTNLSMRTHSTTTTAGSRGRRIANTTTRAASGARSTFRRFTTDETERSSIRPTRNTTR
jgi:hypothetical protein